MRRSSVLVLSFLVAPTKAIPQGYNLLWSDEFSGATLSDKWHYETGTGCPQLCYWGNFEQQSYQKANVAVSGGNLVITAKPESRDGVGFTSGLIQTRGLSDFTYGYVETRIKLPSYKAIWPTFWLLPTNSEYGAWARSGEIDVVEKKNVDKYTYHTIHYGGLWPHNNRTGKLVPFPEAEFNDYHTFGLQWTPWSVRWFKDGSVVSTKKRGSWYSAAAPNNPAAPYDARFFLILSLAVGGQFTGNPPVADIVSSWGGVQPQMVVDYVRFYTNDSSATATPVQTSIPGVVLAGPGWVDLLTTRGNDPRDGNSLARVFSGDRFTYKLAVHETGSYGVTFTLRPSTAVAGTDSCLVDNAKPVRMYIVMGYQTCDGQRHALLNKVARGNRLPATGGYVNYAAATPLTFPQTGTYAVTLCVEQAPYVDISSIIVTKGGPPAGSYPYNIPGSLGAANFGFDTYKDVYTGDCGPRSGGYLGEIADGESYTYDVRANAVGAYYVTYTIATGQATKASFYLVKGADCGGTRYNPLILSSVDTGGYDIPLDTIVTVAPFPVTAVGRQSFTLCIEQAGYMYLRSLNFVKA